MTNNYEKETKLLEEYKIQYFKNTIEKHRRLYFKIFSLQWKIVRAIYQQSDEYKRTRGY